MGPASGSNYLMCLTLTATRPTTGRVSYDGHRGTITKQRRSFLKLTADEIINGPGLQPGKKRIQMDQHDHTTSLVLRLLLIRSGASGPDRLDFWKLISSLFGELVTDLLAHPTLTRPMRVRHGRPGGLRRLDPSHCNHRESAPCS